MSSIQTHHVSRKALLDYLRTGTHPDAAAFARKYNHNHDPYNGQFTSGPGGGSGGSQGSANPVAPSRLRALVATPPPPPRVQLVQNTPRSGGRGAENRLIANGLGETNSFLLETANARIRAIAPTSPALDFLSAPGVPPASSVVRQQLETADYLEGVHAILRPNGVSWLGREFNSRHNRNVYGGTAEFNRLADNLTRGATLLPSRAASKLRYATPSGGTIMLRTGPAVEENTPQIYGVIDINIPGLAPRHFAIKVHK
jgi:hypothetical protein